MYGVGATSSAEETKTPLTSSICLPRSLRILPSSPQVSQYLPGGWTKSTPRKRLLELREDLPCPIRRPRASARPAVRIPRAPAAHKTLYLPLALVPNRQICFRFRRASTRKISCHRFLEMNNLILGPSQTAFRYRKDVGSKPKPRLFADLRRTGII